MRLVHPPEELESNEGPVATAAPAAPGHWPAEVDIILSAMEAGQSFKIGRDVDRRDVERSQYHTQADLRLFAQDPFSPATMLYTRDISPDGMGFITRERMPLGYSGVVSYEQEDGSKVSLACTVFRCREAINGWYEGALHFTN